jgi:hypothetical protein
LKTYGALDQLRGAVKRLGGDIHLAMVYGDQPGAGPDWKSDVNLLIVADGMSYPDVVAGLTEVENRIGRTVEVVLLKPGEFESLREEGNEMVLGILGQPRTVLAGRLD